MAERSNLQAKLNAGIDAVRTGDKTTARRLLQQVISADPDNEVAWMWLASAVNTAAERRTCLERALAINPNNTRAQEALQRMNAAAGASATGRGARTTPAAPRRGGSSNLLVIAAIAIVVVIALAVFSLVTSTQQPNVSTAAVALTQQALVQEPTDPPTIDPDTYTATPIFAVVVTQDRSEDPLPPTFTPTFTPTPSDTPTPTATPIPLSSYRLAYTGIEGGNVSVFSVLADGSEERPLAADVTEFVPDPSGRRAAFVRTTEGSGAPAGDEDATDEPTSGGLPQIFVGPADEPDAAVQITRLTGSQISGVTWSPDGAQLAFTSNDDGDDDVYVVSSDGGTATKLTENEGVDRDPAWSPDGGKIAFASDLDSPAFGTVPSTTEIYTMNPDGTEITRLTDAAGSSYAPAWSPNGAQIVFVSDRSGDSDLYLMLATGEGENLLTFDDGGAEDRTPAFTPDGRWVAFASNRETPQFQVYVVDIRGETVLRVTDNPRDVETIRFYPSAP